MIEVYLDRINMLTAWMDKRPELVQFCAEAREDLLQTNVDIMF